MRVPPTINRNTLKCYLNPNIVNKTTKLNAEYLDWDQNIPLKLSELCVKVLSQEFSQRPNIFNSLMCFNKCLLLEYLSKDVPLEITIPLIDNDLYWKKCFVERWPNVNPDRKLDHLIFETVYPLWLNNAFEFNKTESTDSEISLSEFNIIQISQRSEICEVADFYLENFKSWRTCYLEAHLQEYIENLRPENYDLDEIRKISKLCKPFIISLHLKQLKVSNQPVYHHISLGALISYLSNLTELSIHFGEKNLGLNFTFNKFSVSNEDCHQLGLAVGKSNIKIFRIERSSITCDKLILLLDGLNLNKKLQVIDFSHCKIGDKGAAALADFISEHSKLHTVILTNNCIGVNGAKAFADVFILNGAFMKITNFYINFNAIEDEGCEALANALTSGGKSLRYLNLSACCITENCTAIGRMISLNKTLIEIDLSNNDLSTKVGDAIVNGLKTNKSIEKIDLRLSNVPIDIEILIQQILEKNRQMKHSEATRGRFRFKSDQEIDEVMRKLHLKKWQKIARSVRLKSVVALTTPKCSVGSILDHASQSTND